MEGLDDKFNEKCKRGDFIVAGRNFGCGSSENMLNSFKKVLGVAAVILNHLQESFTEMLQMLGSSS